VEDRVELIGRIDACEETGQEFLLLYRGYHDGPFVLAHSEIECGAFFPLPIIKRWAENRPDDFANGSLKCLKLFGSGQP
jgi:16S rRNA (adenine1518-N6/adenine1519-N6)-dimethyltransferase